MNIDIIGYMGGSITSISLVFQIYKTHMEQSVKDLSVWMLMIKLIGSVLIAIYGILIERPAIYSTITLSISCLVILIFMKVRYKDNKKMILDTNMV